MPQVRLTAAVLLTALLAVDTPLSAESPPILVWKAYAGTIDTDLQAQTDLGRNTRRGIVAPSYSEVGCRSNIRFGAAFHIIFTSQAFASLDVEWRHPHFTDVFGNRQRTHHRIIRRDSGEKSTHFWAVRRLRHYERTDGDIVLTVRHNGRIVGHHVFLVRGCNR